MDATVPKGAALLLDFISGPESEGRYDVIFDHHERELSTPITSMTIGRLLTAQIQWGRKWGSSAAGRYQMMQTTLAGLVRTGIANDDALFGPNVQDELGYALLKRRGYADYMCGRITRQTLALHLAQEWASLPVLVPTKGAHRQIEAGQSYYAGDNLNKALVSAAQFEAALTKAHAAGS